MAGIIIRAGRTAIAAGGLQVGQWTFTDGFTGNKKHAEILHLENPTYTTSGTGQNAFPIASDATFHVGVTDGDRYIITMQDATERDWIVGDALFVVNSAGNDSIGFIVDEVYASTNHAIVSGTGSNYSVGGHRANEYVVGQAVNVGGAVRIIQAISEQGGAGTIFSETTQLTFTASVSANIGDRLISHPTFVSTAQESHAALSGDLFVSNVSLESAAEHFTYAQFLDTPHAFYLTGGTGHEIIVPDGVEIFANTLS